MNGRVGELVTLMIRQLTKSPTHQFLMLLAHEVARISFVVLAEILFHVLGHPAKVPAARPWLRIRAGSSTVGS